MAGLPSFTTLQRPPCPSLSPAVSVQVWPKAIVQEGQLVNLTCLVWTTNQTQLTYIWYQDGQQRPGAHSILLPNVTVTDAASYRCGVLKPGRAPRLSRPVILDVLCESGWMQGGATRDQGMARVPQMSNPETVPICPMKPRTRNTELRVRGDRFSLGSGAGAIDWVIGGPWGREPGPSWF